jgi:hypothetical protein
MTVLTANALMAFFKSRAFAKGTLRASSCATNLRSRPVFKAFDNVSTVPIVGPNRRFGHQVSD